MDEGHYSDQSSDAREEDEEQESAIQSSIFERYLNVCDEAAVDAETDALFAKSLVRVQEYLAGGRDNTRCLICLGSIKPTEAIWSCGSSCFALFHMPCIQEWARNQLEASAARAARVDPSTAAAAAAREWGCPKCRVAYGAHQLPGAYTCFCGKKEDPEWDPWLAPHSCGELCGKPLPGRCSHACLLLCHPGPCPPCPLLVDAPCFCGKAVVKQRCGNNEFSCRSVCGKVLPCGHACPEVCHADECPPCQVVGSHKCACGAEVASLPCWQAGWHCSKPCSRTLACGRHHCDQVCHAGPCGPCPETGERRCPCGKALHPELKCDEQAPVCGATCGKQLDCRVHTCQERCHYGPCVKVCRELVPKPCRCGKIEKQVLCSADVRCDSKCSVMRTCGRHACKRRCCDGNCPPCEEVCNRKLRCGNHRCPATCHSGPCRPCPLSQTISCACGKTSYTLPCGAEEAALPPRCLHKCPVPLVCRHAADAKPHRCHFGPCPPCRAPCGAAQPCGHTCSSSTCHDAPPPAVPLFERPKPPKSGAAGSAGAGDANGKQRPSSGGGAEPQQPQAAAPGAAAAAAAVALTAAGAGLLACPACNVPVEVGCVGGHTQRALPCCTAAPFSCGAACGRPLACGNHGCNKVCHVPVPAAAGTAGGQDPKGHPSSSSQAAAAGAAARAAAAAAGAAEACEVCSRPCDKPRSCRHPCPSTCHPGPCEPCAVTRHMGCHCGKTELAFPCWEQQRIAAAAQQQPQQQQQTQAAPAPGSSGSADPLCCGSSCGRQLPFCPHACAASCHAGPCPAATTCAEEVTVRCSCRRLKEKWGCAKVQAALAAAVAGGGAGEAGGRLYDGSSALKLLPCDAQCAAAQKDKQQQRPSAAAAAQDADVDGSGTPSRGPSPAAAAPAATSSLLQQQPPPAAAAAAGMAAAATAAATASSGSKGTKKLSRAERDALAAAKEAERLARERAAALRGRVQAALVVLLVAGVGVGVLLLLDGLWRVVDRTLTEKYAPEL